MKNKTRVISDAIGEDAARSLMADDQPVTAGGQKVGREQLQEWTRILQRYKAGKAHQDDRVIAAEQWWKLRNAQMEGKGGEPYRSQSAWLHNVIVSKHADAMEAYPEPTILPREVGDRPEATSLSSIIPCVMEQNGMERTYSDVAWVKLKSGTGVYRVTWDSSKLSGMGDISIERANLLNLFWEPGVTDIQRSRYFFQTELEDKDILEQKHPELKSKLKAGMFSATKFLYDDHVDTENKCTVIEVYYHVYAGGRSILHYCKFVEEYIIFATENDPEYAERGWYDHGLYPYVFDILYPIEGSPCGYGYVDLCRSPQEMIDHINTAVLKNTMFGATPRFFKRGDGNINEQEFLDLRLPIVHVEGSIDSDNLRQIDFQGLNGNYLSFLEYTIQELRETSGNTETATGSTTSGVTAASAIAALQEASGKGSRDSTRGAYRAYTDVVRLVIELIRQFYDMPRKFRITGELGQEQFTNYSNAGLQPQYQGQEFGIDMGYRTPTFDIKVGAQKASAYTRVSQNELALQFFQLGFFNPQMTDQALATLQAMDFEGREEIMQMIARNGTMAQQLNMWQQLALTFAQKYEPDKVAGLAQAATGQQFAAPAPGSRGDISLAGTQQEATRVTNARERSNNASQPDGGRVIADRGGSK